MNETGELTIAVVARTIKKHLRRRSGKDWSVTSGYGNIEITIPANRYGPEGECKGKSHT